MKLIKY